MATALSTVFETPELLEMILKNLAFTVESLKVFKDWATCYDARRTLLHAQRVSKTFKTLIATSPHIQRALDFKQAAPPPGRPLFTIGDGDACYRSAEDPPSNTLVREKFIPVDDHGGPIVLHSYIHRDTIFIERFCGPLGGDRKASRVHDSWERMLPTQPPLPAAIDWCRIRRSPKCKRLQTSLPYKQVMTLGEIVETGLEWEKERTGRKRKGKTRL